MHMSNPKEDKFETHIKPLLDQITKLSKEYGINFLAAFSLGLDPGKEDLGPLWVAQVSTLNDKKDEHGAEQITKAVHVLRPGPSPEMQGLIAALLGDLAHAKLPTH